MAFRVPNADDVYGVAGGDAPEPMIEQAQVAPLIIEVEKIVPQAIISDDAIQGYWIGNFGVTSFGIYIGPDATEQEWIDFRQSVDKIESAGDWGKADWCMYGLDTLHKTTDQVAALLGRMTPDSVKVYASIARAAQDKLIRINSPSFSHFRLVMNYDTDHQLEWMRKATANNWSVAKLRKQIDLDRGIVKTSRVSKTDARKVVAAQKTQAKNLAAKGAKLPIEQRRDLATYFRKLADGLELEG